MLIACVGLGAVVGPKITPHLIQKEGGDSEQLAEEVVKPQLEDPILDFDLSEVTKEDFPKYFNLTQPWIASTKEGKKINVEAGSEWKFDHFHGSKVYFTGLQGATGNIHIGHTDLVETLKEAVDARTAEVKAREAAAAAEKAAAEEEARMLAAAEAAAKLEEAKRHKPVSSDELVSLMKSSVETLKEFKANQVISWESGEDSISYQGQDVQTGNIVYSAETLFGTKEIRAQAIVRSGVVLKWIWPTSGLEIH